MQTVNMIRFFAISSTLVIGLAAVWGGMMLVLQPSGAAMQFSLDLLEPTPFPDYFIPGLVLLVVLGFGGWAAGAMTWLKHPRHPWALILYGGILCGWLVIELILNPAFFWPRMHYTLFTAGALLAATGVFFVIRNSQESGPV